MSGRHSAVFLTYFIKFAMIIKNIKQHHRRHSHLNSVRGPGITGHQSIDPPFILCLRGAAPTASRQLGDLTSRERPRVR